MRTRTVTVMLLVLALMALGAPTAQSEAMLADDYSLWWWTTDAGGAVQVTAGCYALSGTAGQPDADVWAGYGYTLAGGFWPGVPTTHDTYLPLVIREMQSSR
ncbi:MAG: hypothetical protein GX601_12400 [Anaerolineales bacterium]|nr:hypothetical protein [Anaerolineales bacterium]